MRHRVKLNHLGRKSAHRKALLSHLACDLIQHKRIITTLAKAKALRVYVEPLITKSKTNTTHQRRVVFSYLQDKEIVSELFGDVSAKIGTRPGGYTRIIKLGARYGDAAEMALIELVDYNELYSNAPAKEVKRKRTRRSGRSHAKSTSSGTEEKQDTKVAEPESKEEPAKAEEPAKEEVKEPKAETAVQEPEKPASEEEAPQKAEKDTGEEPKASDKGDNKEPEEK